MKLRMVSDLSIFENCGVKASKCSIFDKEYSGVVLCWMTVSVHFFFIPARIFIPLITYSVPFIVFFYRTEAEVTVLIIKCLLHTPPAR